MLGASLRRLRLSGTGLLARCLRNWPELRMSLAYLFPSLINRNQWPPLLDGGADVTPHLRTNSGQLSALSCSVLPNAERKTCSRAFLKHFLPHPFFKLLVCVDHGRDCVNQHSKMCVTARDGPCLAFPEELTLLSRAGS